MMFNNGFTYNNKLHYLTTNQKVKLYIGQYHTKRIFQTQQCRVVHDYTLLATYNTPQESVQVVDTTKNQLVNGYAHLSSSPAPKVSDYDSDDELIVNHSHNQGSTDSLETLRIIGFFLQNGLSLILMGTILYTVFMMFRATRTSGAAQNSLMGFTKSRAKLLNDTSNGKEGDSNTIPKVTFDMVAGLGNAKLELSELVDFLKSPEKYEKVGAVVPKGYLLVGPPGTGKTMLAQAVAGEAGVPFFSCSASEFVEMFVGVGASRLRDLFSSAKEKAPCIIFIDELDAIGKARSGSSPGGIGGGNDEREQTINQLLTELNGFEPNQGVMVIAATNRPEILDKALLRPGRFDRQVYIGLPDVNGRVDILKVHTKNKPLATCVNLRILATSTPGFSGAELQQLANEAAINAARVDREQLTQDDFDEALEKITIGLERDGAIRSAKKQRIVATHEAGHALVAALLDDYDEVKKVTISPRGKAGGVTQFLPSADRLDSGLYSREYLEQQLVVALGGRAAEDIVFGEDQITTGASGDMQRVYQIARMMVTQYGFGKVSGTIAWDQAPVLSNEIASMIDKEVLHLSEQAYARAKQIINDNRLRLDALIGALLEKETISGVEVVEIIKSKN